MPCLHAMCICSYVIQHQHATAVSADLQYCYTVLTMLRAHRLCVLWSSSYEHILICDAHYVCCIVSVSLCIIGKCQCGNNRALIPWTINQFSPHTCNDYTCMQKCSIAEWPLMLEILATCILCRCIQKPKNTYPVCTDWAYTFRVLQQHARAATCTAVADILHYTLCSLMEAEPEMPLQHVKIVTA